MKTGITLQQMAGQLVQQQAQKKDYIVGAQALEAVVSNSGAVMLDVKGQDVRYEIGDLMHQQVGEYLKIPRQYYERLRTTQPELLTTSINTLLTEKSERRMLRTIGTRARALLSDRYRRLDNVDLVESVIPVLNTIPDLRFESVSMSDSRLYLKAVTSRIRTEVTRGDWVEAGLVISNSEVGLGAVKVEPLVFRLVCSNGMIAADKALQKYHVGRINTGADNGSLEIFRDETLAADDKAFFMKVADTVRAALNAVEFEKTVAKMRALTDIQLNDPQDTVQELANRFSFNEAESHGVLASLMQGRDYTAYGMLNALTAYSQEVQDYERATDFERFGGMLLELPKTQWKTLAKAA